MLHWLDGLSLLQVLIREDNFELTVNKSLVQFIHFFYLTNMYQSPSTYHALLSGGT